MAGPASALPGCSPCWVQAVTHPLPIPPNKNFCPCRGRLSRNSREVLRGRMRPNPLPPLPTASALPALLPRQRLMPGNSPRGTAGGRQEKRPPRTAPRAGPPHRRGGAASAGRAPAALSWQPAARADRPRPRCPTQPHCPPRHPPPPPRALPVTQRGRRRRPNPNG